MRAEQAIAETDRLLLRGSAGSGKSTLVQGLALNSARRTFTDDMADWNRCVPFVLRLRAFTASETLPAPDDFLRAAGVPLRAPEGWAERLLTEGRALILVDGVDKVPTRLRKRTEDWLKNLIVAYPIPALTSLTLWYQEPLDLEVLGRFTGLRSLSLMECTIPDGLGPLRDLPALRSLNLSHCTPHGPLDLGPLAGLTELTIRVSDDTRIMGSEPIPPSRIVTTRSRL